MYRLALAIALIALVPTVALAQSAASTTINTAPLFTELFNDYVLPIAGTVAAGLVGWAATWFTKKTGIEVSQQYRDAISQAAEKEANVLLGKITNMQAFNIDVKNPAIAGAANSLLGDLQPAIAGLGLTPQAAQAYVSKEIAAHLGATTATMPDVPGPAIAPPPPAAA